MDPSPKDWQQQGKIRIRIDPKLQSNVEIPYGWTDCTYHVGASLGCRSIADPFFYSLEELVAIEEGKRAASRQWTLCMSLALVHCIPLISRDWSYSQFIEDGIKMQFIGSI